MRDVVLSFNYDQLSLLVAALDVYQASMEDSLRREEHFYNGYSSAYRKLNVERSRSAVLARAYQVDQLKAYVLTHMPSDYFT